MQPEKVNYCYTIKSMIGKTEDLTVRKQYKYFMFFSWFLKLQSSPRKTTSEKLCAKKMLWIWNVEMLWIWNVEMLWIWNVVDMKCWNVVAMKWNFRILFLGHCTANTFEAIYFSNFNLKFASRAFVLAQLNLHIYYLSLK